MAQALSNIDLFHALRHLVFAVVTGAITGLASVLLCICVGFSFQAWQAVPWIVWLLPLSGVLQVILYHAFRLSPGMSTDMVVNKIRHNRHVSYLLAPGILIGTCMSIICGGSVGKEAGALQMGASLGSLIARPFKLRPVDASEAKAVEASAQSAPGAGGAPQRRIGAGSSTAVDVNAVLHLNGYPAAVGMASCFAALFFAPLGSCMFVLELTRFKPAVRKHGLTMLVACFVAFGVASLIGIGDIIPKVAVPTLSWPIVGQCILVGVCTAVAGSLFAKGIKGLHGFTLKVRRNYFLWVIAGGLGFALLMTVFPWERFAGTGGDQLTAVLHGTFEPWDFAIKALLTLICLGFWFKGGEIMPSFCIGGLLGASVTYMAGGSPEFTAAVGVISFFSAFSRCPLAAFLMGCEIFGWGMAPYMAIGAGVAYWVGSPFGMYGAGMDRAVKRLFSRGRRQLSDISR